MYGTKGYGPLVSKVLSSQEQGSASKKITNKFFLNWVTMLGHH